MYMNQDRIQEHLRQWLMRKVPNTSFCQVTDLPIAIASDIGLVRSENQDRAVILKANISEKKSFIVGVLSDGMGGMFDGGECASLAVASFISSCIRYRNENKKELLCKALNQANMDVYNQYQGKGGATLSAFFLDSNGNFEAINVGDSRIYLVINNELDQISIDDTIAGQLRQKPDQAQLNTHLLQYVGMGDDIEPHILSLPESDKISKMLLTSDGVHYIEHKTLQAILLQDANSVDLSKRLIYISKWCGGHDNASVLLFSNLTHELLSTDHVPTGSVQIWDSFGEVQLIGIESSTRKIELNAKQTVSIDKNLEKTVATKVDELEKTNPKPKAKPKAKPKPKPKAKPKAKPKVKAKPKADDYEETLDKPQLRIEFDE